MYKFSPSTLQFYPDTLLDMYSSLPSDLVDVTDEEYVSAINRADGEGLEYANDALIITPAPIPTAAELLAQSQAKLKADALTELDIVTGPRGTIMRCLAAGVAVPAEWTAYVKSLRDIANGTDTTSTTLPTKPAYPAGT